MKEYFYSASYVISNGAVSFAGFVVAENGIGASALINRKIEFEVNRTFRNEFFDESNVHISSLNLF